VSSGVQAVCDWCGPTDFLKWEEIPEANKPGIEAVLVKLFGGTPQQKKELAILANPITHIKKNTPPFLIIHGDIDDLVPLNHSVMLDAALKKAGGFSELIVKKGWGHGFNEAEVFPKIFEFFDKTLKNS
jgi:dipeptidyl aminopeptidase/acylaminoacyl peptidase